MQFLSQNKQNIVLTAWPTKMSMPVFRFPDKLLQDACIILQKVVVILNCTQKHVKFWFGAP